MRAFLHMLVDRLLGVLRRQHRDADFEQELHAHLAMAEAALIQRGMPAEQARAMARAELGGVAQLREAASAARGLPWLSGLSLDLKLGLRMLRRSWGLTVVGGLAMAVTIGIGASAATILNMLTGTAVPLEEGDRVVALHAFDPLTRHSYKDSTPLADLVRWRETLRSVADISAARRDTREVITPDGPLVRMSVAEMTASGFQVARGRALLGRTLTEDDERPGAAPVAVIGYDVWQSAFSADPAALGMTVQLDGTPHVVVGVMPPGFAFPVNDRIWTPLDPRQADGAGVFVFARLAPGSTFDHARAEVATIGVLPRHAPSHVHPHLQARLVPYAYGLTDVYDNQWVGTVVLGLVALLLVPPCANIAILVYARTVTRRDEFAARAALGASRSRIVAQVFVEVLVLAMLSGVGGFVLASQFAWQAAQVVIPGWTQSLPFWMDFRPSFMTVLAVAGLAVLAAAIAGGVPALQAIGPWRRHSLAGNTAGTRLGTTWTALLAVQVALSLAVLPSTIEMAWGMFRPAILGPEFPIQEILTAQLVAEANAAGFGDARAEVVRRLHGGPGITGVSESTAASMEEPEARIDVEGGRAGAELAAFNSVDREFFEVFAANVLVGRGFRGADFDAVSTSIIVNRSFVEDVLGNGNPLGRRIRFSETLRGGAWLEPSAWREIVGVVDNFPSDNPGATMYFPLAPGPRRSVTLTLRVGANATLVTGQLKEIADALRPAVRVGQVRTLESVHGQRQSVANTVGALLTTVTAIVLLFSMAGIYTLMAFTVARRWKEIGLRAALGAQPVVLVAGLFGRTLLPVAGGAAAGGVIAALIDARVELSQAGAREIPGILPACVALLMAVGLLALVGPARRALRIHPAVALRDN